MRTLLDHQLMVTYLDENEMIRHEEEMTREGQEADDLRQLEEYSNEN